MNNYILPIILVVCAISSLPATIGYSYSNRHYAHYGDDSSSEEDIPSSSGSDELNHNSVISMTHSEKENRYAVPIYQKIGVPVPHPIPVAVPQYVKVNIPQPYPVQVNVEQKIKVPVYRIVPKIIERPVPYTVEKSYPVEVEKPFPVEVLKKIEVPVPKPYPVPVPVYRHVTDKGKNHRRW
ncbi:uncharacterized protein LOC129780417 [Toxorhynchites rutilus septentrionalis]|uniref:uncharacterized protein LOC129780417 n=1 Tax=Toxorhynchites rutilus septentrionalis TaxID=329112 RepID=UPI0024791137|nr:uncharacterized protein LOC129780417 [Toxorhynchites rutilus septentrionalis]XP_055644662.1 uncharacterized protein LOC129780417 [Toxorhynchites rutilus septentrionalis]